MKTESLLGNKCKVCGYDVPVEDRVPEGHRLLVLFSHIKASHYGEMNFLQKKILDMTLKQNGLDMESIDAYLGKLSDADVEEIQTRVGEA